MPVFLTLILPFYFIYHVVFPIIWFSVGYVVYSFQLFPISRISNRWLYLLVYSFTTEKDSYRRRFDTSDAIILPMVQKGKVEETILESVPQLIIQLLNTYMLGEITKMPLLTLFSISLSVLSLSNTIWYYAYWNLFRCKPIRDVPSSLSLYNYKLSGVTDGRLSFGKPSHDVNEFEMTARDQMLSVTIGDTLFNPKSEKFGLGSDELNSDMPRKIVAAGLSEIEVVRPYEDDAGMELAVESDFAAPAAANGMEADALDHSQIEIGNSDYLGDGAAVDIDNCDSSSAACFGNQLLESRAIIRKLEAEKRLMAEELRKMKQELLNLSASSRVSDAIVDAHAPLISDDLIVKKLSEDDPFETVGLH